MNLIDSADTTVLALAYIRASCHC